MQYGQEKEKDNVNVGEEERKLSLFIDDVFVYMEDPEESNTILL